MIDMALYRIHSLTAQMKSQMSCKYLQKYGGGALGSAPGYGWSSGSVFESSISHMKTLKTTSRGNWWYYETFVEYEEKRENYVLYTKRKYNFNRDS